MIPRLPCTISLIRRGGTPMETASSRWVMPNPSMKSFIRTSPGWIGSILSVVVNDLDLLWSCVKRPGSQFRARSFVHALNEQHLHGSMGQVGAVGDNAAMESYFALLQKKVLDRRR